MIRSLYRWTMHWAASPKAVPALLLIAVAESAFFPIPPDLLLIPMVLAAPSRGLFLAGVCTLGSVVGGGLGYLIGFQFWDLVGDPIIRFYGATARYQELQGWFNQYDVWIVAVAGFSPIPYKLFTITAGAMKSNFLAFMFTSLLARGARFYLVAGLLRWGGDRLREWVEKYLDWLTAGITVLLVGGFIVVKLLM